MIWKKLGIFSILVILVISLFSLSSSIAGQFCLISVDGDISDWAGINPSLIAGDPAIDWTFNAVYIANDQNYLYLRMDCAIDTNVTFGIDVDLNWYTLNPYASKDMPPSTSFGGILYHTHYGDASMGYYQTSPPGTWEFGSFSPYTNQWVLLTNQNDPQNIQTAYNSAEKIVEIAIPLIALDIRNEFDQIWLAFPFAPANGDDYYRYIPVSWLSYDIVRRSGVALMQVARYTGTPVTYQETFNAKSGTNYKLVITDSNLTSVDVFINGIKLVQLGDGHTEYEGIIPPNYLNYEGTNTIEVTPKGQPETSALVEVLFN